MNNTTRFGTRGQLRGGVSFVALMLGASMCPSVAFAQTAQDPPTEATETPPLSAQTDPDQASAPSATVDESEIIVTGQRRALRSAQQIKRNADTVVDSITATDIGAFPDKSVAEALQRVPGITVNRFAGKDDTAHFSAEPSNVLVRGLPQVRSEFNGRDTFTANSSRGLSFSDVTPELMAGVDVYKNQTAELIEGGIAGSVNLRTRVPFDAPGQLFQIGANINYGDLAKKWTPDANVFYSNRWETGIGEVGIMANVAFSEITSRSQGVQHWRVGLFSNVTEEGNPGFVNAPATAIIPAQTFWRDNEFDRKRTGLAFAGQWKSKDDRLLFTTQFNRSVYKNEFYERTLYNTYFELFGTPHSFRFTNDNAAVPRQPPGAPAFTFGSDGYINSGTFSGYSTWAGPPGGSVGFGANEFGEPIFQACYTWGCPSGGPVDNYLGVVGTFSRSSKQRSMTQDFSGNLKWEATDRLRFNVDVQRVNSTLSHYDIEVDLQTRANMEVDFEGRPTVTLSQPTNNNIAFSPGGLSNPNNWHVYSVMDHIEDSKGKQHAVRGDGEYDLDTDWLDSLKFGARYADRKQKVQYSTYNWANFSNTWTDFSPCTHPYFNLDSPAGSCGDTVFAGYPDGAFVADDFGSRFHGGSFGELMFVPRNFFDDRGADQFSAERIGGGSFIPTCDREGQFGTRVELEGSCYAPEEVTDVRETTQAAYAMLRFGGPDARVGGLGISGNLGVRYVGTRNLSNGFTQFPLLSEDPAEVCPATPLVPGGFTGTFVPPTGLPPGTNPYSPVCYLSPEDQQFVAATDPAEQRAKVKHHHWLPSFNLRVDLSPKWLVRFAASKAMSRPDIGLLKNFTAISQDLPDRGNPTDPRWQRDSGGNIIGVTPTYTANSFNPFLKPTTAWQFDLSLENYFSNVGSFSFAVFLKKFSDYQQYGLFNREFTQNGVTREVRVRGPANGKGAKITGFEVAYQRFFDFLPGPLDGLGAQANFTYLKNKGIPNSGLITGSGDGTNPTSGFSAGTTLQPVGLEGLSKYSYNLVGMYEKYGFAARLAYNWRSKYLVTAIDCCVALPVYERAAGYLDGSLRYTVNKNVELSLQGSNLLNTETRLVAQATDESSPEGERIMVPNGWFQNDRRVTMGVRVKFGQ